MTFSRNLVDRATAFVQACAQQELTLSVAESCTGGLLAGLVTEVPGSSFVLQLGVVSYARSAKRKVLAVPAQALKHGEVSEQVAMAMAIGVMALGKTDLAAGITGIAGPGGERSGKPVGLVYIAAIRRGVAAEVRQFLFGDVGRAAVRTKSVSAALAMLEDLARTK